MNSKKQSDFERMAEPYAAKCQVYTSVLRKCHGQIFLSQMADIIFSLLISF
jgi:hypothetical protein